MAYNPIEAYNPELWGVSREVFDGNATATVRMPDIITGGHQNAGAPLNNYPFFVRTLEKTQKTNPVSFQWFAFGTSTVGVTSPEDYPKSYSKIDKFVCKNSLVGYAAGDQVENNSTTDAGTLVGSGMPCITGDGSDTVSNGLWNNLLRWYPNKASVDETLYNWWLYLKIPVTGICCDLTIYAYPPMYDYEEILTGNMDPWKTTRSFTYDEYLENQSSYPNIVSVEVNFYLGSDTSRNDTTMAFVVPAATNTMSIWKKYTKNTDTHSWELTNPDYGKVSPQGSNVYSYCNTTTIYQGFHASSEGTGQTHWFLCRGLDSHKFYHIIERFEWFPRAHIYAVYDGTPQELLDALNKMGIPWTTNPSKARIGDILNDPDIHMPIVDPKTGAVTGETTDPEEKKKEAEKRPFISRTDPTKWPIVYGDSEDPDDPTYDPEEDPEEEKEADEIEMGNPALGTVGVFNRTYAINAEELHALSGYLWNVDSTEFEKIIKGLGLMGNNPINAIISVVMFPFEVGSGTPSTIRIGVVDTDVTAVPITYSDVHIYNLGECYFWAKYKNYLDYEPYTTASLYIPYVGIIPIPVSEYLKKWITVRLAVDLMTGSGQIVVYADGIPTIYRNCKIGCQIAVTGQDSSRIAANYISAASELVSAGTGLAQSVASGNAGGIIGGAMSAAHGAIDLYTAGHVPIESRGSDSPQCGFYMPQQCYLIVNRPNPADIDLATYGATIGFACCEAGVIGSFAGFSKFDNVQLNITTATEAEKREIIDKLRGGVYV
jgi:hypothetical protein